MGQCPGDGMPPQTCLMKIFAATFRSAINRSSARSRTWRALNGSGSNAGRAAHQPKPKPGRCGQPESCGDLATLKERWQEVDRSPRALHFRPGRRATDGRIGFQTAQRRSQFNAAGRSDAACRQSRDLASRPGGGNDPPAWNRSAFD